MSNTYHFQLIKGSYSSEDAKEMLQELIKSKINFHNIKNFTSEIRFNITSPDSRERIEYLKNARRELMHFIENNPSSKGHFEIHAEVHVTYQPFE